MMSKSLEAVFHPERFTAFRGVADAAAFGQLWASDRRTALAGLAHTAYLPAAQSKLLIERLGGRATPYNEQGAQAFLALWPDFGVLAFRGSEPSEDKPQKIIPRLFGMLRSGEPLRKFGLRFGSELARHLANDVLADLAFNKVPFSAAHPDVEVHEGFLGEIDKLWNPIRGDLPEDVALWATGHSLGAALATLAGMRYRFKEVVTFGEPRVGHNIGNAFQGDAHTRIVNGDDPVTRVPPEVVLGYEHHGELVSIRDPDGSTDFTFDHSIVYYTENLKALAARSASSSEQ